MENHHHWEPHNETAADHFCGVCGTCHHWEQNCPDDDIEDGNYEDDEA